MTYEEILNSQESMSFKKAFMKIKPFMRTGRCPPSEIEELYNLTLHNYRVYIERVVVPFATDVKSRRFIK